MFLVIIGIKKLDKKMINVRTLLLKKIQNVVLCKLFVEEEENKQKFYTCQLLLKQHPRLVFHKICFASGTD